jgi:hypothetical protein
MAKKDDRPIDVGLAALIGSDEANAIAFWKKRMELIGAIPNDIARVGALTPQLRELTRISNDAERERLTKSRVIAFAQLPTDVRQRIAAARMAAWNVDGDVMRKDQALVDKILPSLDPTISSVYPRAPTA